MIDRNAKKYKYRCTYCGIGQYHLGDGVCPRCDSDILPRVVCADCSKELWADEAVNRRDIDHLIDFDKTDIGLSDTLYCSTCRDVCRACYEYVPRADIVTVNGERICRDCADSVEECA